MAKKHISQTERCHLLERISNSVWTRMVRAHRVKTDLKEIGITADIISDILNFNLDEVANFEVYAKPGWDEDMYGSDMDFFIETSANQYRWFALQAKILKKNNRYTSLRQTSDGVMQWDKLALLEAISGCKAYYLLYNGRDSFTATAGTDCKGTYLGEQYGCSLVEPMEIERLANIRRGTRYVNPTFEDIHPNHATPWRMLTCCLHSTQNITLYPKNEILESDLTFILIDELQLEDELDVHHEEVNFNQRVLPPINNNNPIAVASREAGWNPGLRFIINRTDNFIA